MTRRIYIVISHQGFPGSSDGKESTCNVGDTGSISESGRSRGEVNGNALQCSSLENPMDRGAWQATVHGVAKDKTERLTCLLSFISPVILGQLCQRA